MATIQSLGVGSGLDIHSLVQQLVAAERQPGQDVINRDQARANATVSALGKLRGAMSTLNDAAAGFATAADLQPRKVDIPDTDFFTATATAQAAPGTYAVQVQQLASAQKLTSAALGAAGTAIGSGDLMLELGSDSFTVSLDAPATAADIRDAINTSADNPGIRASLVTGDDGDHLVLASDHSGSANTLSVSTANGDGGLLAVTYSAGQPDNYSQTTAAADAVVKVDGVTYTGASNTIDGMVSGVTLTVTAADPDVSHSLVISQDQAALTDKLSSFVTSYNALVSVVAEQTKYDPAAKTAAALNGDAMTRGIQSTLRTIVGSQVSAAGSTYDTLASIGLTTQADGTLALDNTKLKAALSTNFDAVGRLFAGSGGVASQMAGVLESYLGADGMLDQREDALNTQLKSIQNQQDRLDTRMTLVQDSYTKQFSALDTLIAQMQNTSNYLAQQLGSSGGNLTSQLSTNTNTGQSK